MFAQHHALNPKSFNVMNTFHKPFIYMCCCLTAIAGYAQETTQAEAFEKVKASFERMYPAATVTEWELEKNNIYEVEFLHEDVEYEADFTADGQWLSTERDLRVDEMPTAVSESLKASEWANWHIDEIEQLSIPEQKEFYEVEVEQGEEKHYLYYLPDGSLMEQTTRSQY